MSSLRMVSKLKGGPEKAGSVLVSSARTNRVLVTLEEGGRGSPLGQIMGEYWNLREYWNFGMVSGNI